MPEPSNLPITRAGSDGRRNTCLQSSCRSLETQGFSGTLIQSQRDFVEIGLRIAGQVGFFREVLSQQPVSVFVRAALPRTLRITEVDFYIRGHREALVFGHLQPSVPRQRAPQGRGELTNLPAQRGDDRRWVFACPFGQEGKTRESNF